MSCGNNCSCKVTGACSTNRGFTGPTGPAGGGAGFWRLGVDRIDAAVGAATDIVVPSTDVPTLATPGKTAISIFGTSDGTGRVVLPLPASDALAYDVIIENISDSTLVLATTPSSAPSGATVSLPTSSNQEDSFRGAVGDIIAAGDAVSYRTTVFVDPTGVYLSPGYSQTGGG